MSISDRARPLFPSLNQRLDDGKVPIFFDGAGGAQVPAPVIKAVSEYLSFYNSNIIPGSFFAAKKTMEVMNGARESVASFFNAGSPSEISFGANMSSRTSHISRSISQEWSAGDEIIVTALDHYSNVSFWELAAKDKNVKCHKVNLRTEDATLDYDHLSSLINSNTKLIAFTLASNVCGSLVDAKRIVRESKKVGALTFIDAVHYAPHFLPDVQDLDCDFMVGSAYKFCGPHVGFLYGKLEHLEKYKPYRVEPVSAKPPLCWEMGTQNFSGLNGLIATIEYLSSWGKGKNLREKLRESYKKIFIYEQYLTKYFLDKALKFKGLKVHGITDPENLSRRTPTFALSFEDNKPADVSNYLANHNIAAWAGSFHAPAVIEQLGLQDQGGALRVSLMHYNTTDEIDILFEVLSTM